MINSINFGAKLVSCGDTIQQFDWLKRSYTPAKVNIVELDATDFYDMKVVREVAKNWKDAKYIDSISGIVNSIFARFIDKTEHSIYAVTTQKKNHSRLKTKKILGLAEINTSKEDNIKLDFLQVKPEYMQTEKDRKYRGIGQCLLNFLKKFHKKSIFLHSDYSVTPFYEKNDFEVLEPGKLDYIWKPGK